MGALLERHGMCELAFSSTTNLTAALRKYVRLNQRISSSAAVSRGAAYGPVSLYGCIATSMHFYFRSAA
jgi:hypothetical protein